MKISIVPIILVALASLAGVLVVEVSAQCGEVKFSGVVATAEEWGPTVCYGSYWCYVIVEEIFYDPNSTLSLGDSVSVCYIESLNLKAGEHVEVYGCYYVLGVCLLQFCGHVACIEDPYYVTGPQLLYGDLNYDGIVNLEDVIIIAGAFGSYLGHPRWNEAADIDNNGIINVIDVVKVAMEFGKTA